MYEQSSRFRALEEVLDHPTNRDRDEHERSALYRRLCTKDTAELDRERRKLDARDYE